MGNSGNTAGMPAGMNGALDGVKVLDFSTLLPGPMATLFLADAGAEVIKVERPGKGDEMRSYTPKWDKDAVNYHMLNRGKKSLAVDLKAPDSRDLLTPLIKGADIVVEQFRPGVMARLGLGYDDMVQINPAIIYCAITGYGQDGPAQAEAGHDLNYIARSGLLSMSLGNAETPVIPPALIADIAGGTYPALFNILLALRQRDQTGQGAFIDVSMAENLFPFMYWALGDGQVAGQWPGSGDALVTGGSPRYRLYPTQDGYFVAVAALEQKFWTNFVQVIDLPENLRDDAVDAQATMAGIGAILRSRSAAEWEPLLYEADCCCTLVKTPQQAMQDPHFKARGVFEAQLKNAKGELIAALPTPIAREFRAHADGPLRVSELGEDNPDFLQSFSGKDE